jgi:hypothetical protein
MFSGVASNCRVTVNDESKITRKDAVVAHFKVLPSHLNEITEEKHKHPQDSWFLCGNSNLGSLKYETGLASPSPRGSVQR